jgi:hypothetical protein
MRVFSKTREVVASAVAAHKTMSDVLRELDMGISGGNFLTLKSKIREWRLSTDHWLGSGYARGRSPSNKGKRRPLCEILVEQSPCRGRGDIKRRLIADSLLKNKCAVCGLLPEWNTKPLVLVLDHINGIGDDYRLENLRLLCPNCNSQTDTFGGRNIAARYRQKRTCVDCGKGLAKWSAKRCRKCAPKISAKCKIEWPDNNELLEMVGQSNVRQVSIRLGVAYNSVKSRLFKIRRSGGTADTPVSNTGASA